VPEGQAPHGQQAASGEQQQGAAGAKATAGGKAAAALATLLGGQPFMPDMLLDVVNAFRPAGGNSGSNGGGNIVLGTGGSRRANGLLALEVGGL